MGTLDNSEAKGYYQAGGIDYGKRYTDAYKDFKQIVKDNQLPPGPPNIKYIYAQEFMAGLQNNEVVSDLTLLNQLSLDEWMEINSDKDPGPPVCEPPFCDTGGNIDTGSLPENEVYFFHPDHLGSTSYITNISGETVQFNSYLPFGETFVSQKRTSTISNYLFNSKEVDSETGLYYYGARYYNAQISSWLSVDPIVYAMLDDFNINRGGVFRSMNLNNYNFVSWNPVNITDPNGMCEGDECKDYKAEVVFQAQRDDCGNIVKDANGNEINAKYLTLTQISTGAELVRAKENEHGMVQLPADDSNAKNSQLTVGSSALYTTYNRNDEVGPEDQWGRPEDIANLINALLEFKGNGGDVVSIGDARSPTDGSVPKNSKGGLHHKNTGAFDIRLLGDNGTMLPPATVSDSKFNINKTQSLLNILGKHGFTRFIISSKVAAQLMDSIGIKVVPDKTKTHDNHYHIDTGGYKP